MEKITSFTIDHTKLKPGMYISRIDDDITTYDLRFVKPNTSFLEVPGIHTIEHLFATYSRNSKYKNNIIYFGPMGCRTGFYLLLRNLSEKDSINLVLTTIEKCINHTGEIPGQSEIECGNYKEHDLNEGKEVLKKYYKTIKNIDIKNLKY